VKFHRLSIAKIIVFSPSGCSGLAFPLERQAARTPFF
jgi:hypothetical protein